MAVTPGMIAVALGVAAPDSGSVKEQQWAMWIADAEMLIETRRLEVDETLVLDPQKLDYVVREAVVAHARKPDQSSQVATTVDDTTVSRSYRDARGRVFIEDEWWTLLGLSPRASGAFSFRPSGAWSSIHAPWCALAFGALYCSCGADIAGYPIYEQGA